MTIRYKRLLPSSRIRVVVGVPSQGGDSKTSRPTGTITLRTGMSEESFASTLAHELVHARTGFGERVEQNIVVMSGNDREHYFLDKLDQAVHQHIATERRVGRPLWNSETLKLNATAEVVEYQVGTVEAGQEVATPERDSGIDLIADRSRQKVYSSPLKNAARTRPK